MNEELKEIERNPENIHNSFYNLQEKNKAIFNETIRSFQTLSQI